MLLLRTVAGLRPGGAQLDAAGAGAAAAAHHQPRRHAAGAAQLAADPDPRGQRRHRHRGLEPLLRPHLLEAARHVPGRQGPLLQRIPQVSH